MRINIFFHPPYRKTKQFEDWWPWRQACGSTAVNSLLSQSQRGDTSRIDESAEDAISCINNESGYIKNVEQVKILL
jgi:hypothetical protein